MNITKESMLLYAVTDRAWLKGARLADHVEQCIRAGVTFVQLREKKLSFEEFVQQARAVKEVTDRYHIPFVINDNPQVAAAVKADGVHVGQGDLSPREIRRLLGPNAIIGVSAKTVEQAQQAQREGASYLGVGAAFSTTTKEDASTITLERYRDITASVSIPVVAIGGIQQNNVLALKGTGIDGIAVVSAIFAQPDIGAATRELLALAKQVCDK